MSFDSSACESLCPGGFCQLTSLVLLFFQETWPHSSTVSCHESEDGSRTALDLWGKRDLILSMHANLYLSFKRMGWICSCWLFGALLMSVTQTPWNFVLGNAFFREAYYHPQIITSRWWLVPVAKWLTLLLATERQTLPYAALQQAVPTQRRQCPNARSTCGRNHLFFQTTLMHPQRGGALQS